MPGVHDPCAVDLQDLVPVVPVAWRGLKIGFPFSESALPTAWRVVGRHVNMRNLDIIFSIHPLDVLFVLGAFLVAVTALVNMNKALEHKPNPTLFVFWL